METEEIDKELINNFNVGSICHVGAHDGLEVQFYYENKVKKVIWVEANYKIINQLINKTSIWNIKNIYIPFALSDINDELLTFNISNNGESSSFMEMGEIHKKFYPEIDTVETIKVLTKRFDKYVQGQNDFDWGEIQMLVVDCQGADLKVLKGFGDLLSSPNLKIIKCEVNFGEMYINNPSEDEINEYLQQFGFQKSYWFKVYNGSWGNTYWVR